MKGNLFIDEKYQCDEYKHVLEMVLSRITFEGIFMFSREMAIMTLGGDFTCFM